MRKQNPQFRWHLTAKEKREIARRTRARERQSEIARAMHLTAPTVGKAQREMGLPTRLVVPEKKILELFEKGWGGYRISRHLHVPVNQVYAVAHRNHFHRADGAGYPTPAENEARFIAAVRNREDYIIRLARKYEIGICKAQRLAREILATPRFRPGLSQPALSSDFPQRHYDVALGAHQREEETLRLIVKSAIATFGRIPEDVAGLTRLIAVCIEVSVEIFKREKPEVYLARHDQEKIVDFFMPKFLQTVTMLRTAQSGLVH
jgi:hypothetical protein